MIDVDSKILDMLNCNVSISKMARLLDMDVKDIYERIKNIVISISGNLPQQIEDPNAYYNVILSEDHLYREILLEISDDSKELHFLVISDTHIGNKYADINLLSDVYNYAKKNGISIIFNCGDVIEGSRSSAKKVIPNTKNQVEYLIKNFPYDSGIKNYMIFGNHDFNSLYYDNYDISRIICGERKDIISMGYGKGIVNFQNDSLLLEHNLSIAKNPKIKDNSKISLVGHGHMMKTKVYDKLYICVPTLSNTYPDMTQKVLPGFIDMIVHLDNRKIEFVELKHMVIVKGNIIQASESRCKMKALKINDHKSTKTDGK